MEFFGHSKVVFCDITNPHGVPLGEGPVKGGRRCNEEEQHLPVERAVPRGRNVAHPQLTSQESKTVSAAKADTSRGSDAPDSCGNACDNRDATCD